jgi:hypothetical protein
MAVEAVGVVLVILWSFCPTILQFCSTSALEQISLTFFLFLASFSSFLYHLLLIAKRSGTIRSEIGDYFSRPGFPALPAFASGVLFTAVPNLLLFQLFLFYPVSKVQHLLMFTISAHYIRQLVYRVPMDSETIVEGVLHLLAIILSFFPGWLSSALQGQSVPILVATFTAGIVASALAGSRPFFSPTGALDDFIHSFGAAVTFAALSLTVDGFRGISDFLEAAAPTTLAIAVVYGIVVDGVVRTIQNDLVVKSGTAVLDGFSACQALYGTVIGGLLVKDAAIHDIWGLAVNVFVGGCDAGILMCALRIGLPEVRQVLKDRREYVRVDLS